MAELGKNIDEDVLKEILSILPPKTLMRFKCVSKLWHALIISPRFVAKHLSNSMHKKLATSTTRVLLKHYSVQKDTDDKTEEIFSLLNFCIHGGDKHVSLTSCEDVKIPLHMSLETRGESLCIIGHCNGIICLAMANFGEVLLWNPATEEYKLLPTPPHLPDSQKQLWCVVRDALGFGYDLKSNDYKVVNVFTGYYEECDGDGLVICFRPKVAVYTLSTDTWRKANKSYSLETETTLLHPMKFQIYFQGFCYWFGHEKHKEIDVYDRLEERDIREVIILFDMGNEIFDFMLLPVRLLDWNTEGRLLVWNESIAFFGTESTECNRFSSGIWIMDKGNWTKQFTFEFIANPLAFLKSDEILMADANGVLFSYNLGNENRKYLTVVQTVSSDSAAVVYVDSIVPLIRRNKHETTGDDSTGAEFSVVKCSQISHPIADNERYMYSVWAIPPMDVSLRIKNVMDGLRAEFGGPEIEPHIPVVGSILITHEEVLSKFRSLQSQIVYSFKAKVDKVVTRKFYYQCVSLLIDSSYEVSPELEDATTNCGRHFDFHIVHRPRLSLLCGNLTGEERNIAREKVSSMDEGITSLSFPITRLALYKINYRDTTLKSWMKIAEYPLLIM